MTFVHILSNSNAATLRRALLPKRLEGSNALLKGNERRADVCRLRLGPLQFWPWLIFIQLHNTQPSSCFVNLLGIPAGVIRVRLQKKKKKRRSKYKATRLETRLLEVTFTPVVKRKGVDARA